MYTVDVATYVVILLVAITFWTLVVFLYCVLSYARTMKHERDTNKWILDHVERNLQKAQEDLDESRDTQRRLHRRAQAAESFEIQTLRPLKADLTITQELYLEAIEKRNAYHAEMVKYRQLVWDVGYAQANGRNRLNSCDVLDVCRCEYLDAQAARLTGPLPVRRVSDHATPYSPLLNEDREGL